MGQFQQKFRPFGSAAPHKWTAPTGAGLYSSAYTMYLVKEVGHDFCGMRIILIIVHYRQCIVFADLAG